MSGGAVALVLTADDAAARRLGEDLFPGVSRYAFSRAELRPAEAFSGRLAEALGGLPAASRVGLVVTGVRQDSGAAAAFPVADHVNLALRGPLCARWPSGRPRAFPALNGIYQPAHVRSAGGPRVYSSGVVVAGVADAGRLTPFESGVVAERGFSVVSDSLVPAAIYAAYFGLTLAACVIARAPERDRE